jgi:DNA-binding response OmpR family regulator
VDAPVPDVILLDLKLPGGKSEDVLTKLADESGVANTPVIGMTNSATEADIAQKIGIDLDAFVQKPLDPDEFLAVVREFESFGLSIVRYSPSETA